MGRRPLGRSRPLGVVCPEGADQTLLSSIHERPVESEFISCGMYILSRSAVDQIDPYRYDMPELVQKLLPTGHEPNNVRLFHFEEPWVAVERLHELDEVSHDPMWHVWVENLCKS